MNDYVARVICNLQRQYPYEPEYLQAVQLWLELIGPAADDPQYEKLDLITRMVEPERLFAFPVSWVDDQGQVHTNHGYRVQFSSAIGPYKGGLRFHPGVNPSVVKFLGFEQTYKNALTGLPIGGGAGGAALAPHGKSRRGVLRVCRRAESSALTGKGLTYGGSQVRLEAAGFGTVYFLARMLECSGDSLEGKTIAASGFGNMTCGVCRKAAELGAKVVTLSGPDGYVYDPDGVCTEEKFQFLTGLRAGGQDKVEHYAQKFGAQFFPGRKPWEVPVDIAVPCATQNEVDVADAAKLLTNGTKYYIEASNMPSTPEAIRLMRMHPGLKMSLSRASGSGGVVLSALEMAQNSIRDNWTQEEMERRLQATMVKIYDQSAQAAAQYGLGDDLVAGSAIASFQKIAQAKLAQGV